MEKIIFGDIFRHKDKPYVWLGSDGEVIFAALVLNYDETKALQTLRKRYEKIPSHSMNDSTLLCYVVLQTEKYKDQAASLNRTGDHGIETGIVPDGRLCEEDVKKLRMEICEDKSIPEKLKKIVKQTVK
ncbi:MAG: hypothetical protein NTY22_07895 [Proteobacteria bacterium]|nr:hypothetical protein [Pseudomonadota bacterium]